MKMQKVIFWLLIFSACSQQNKYKEEESYLEQEIRNRVLLFEKDNTLSDSLRVEAVLLEKEVNSLILLSKDVENIGASVSLGNKYFKDLGTKYGWNDLDFVLIRQDMHLDEISLTLKQNELNVLNQLLFRSGKSNIPVYSAH